MRPYPVKGARVVGWIDLYDTGTGRKIRRFEGHRAGGRPGILAGRTLLAEAAFHEGKPVVTLWDAVSGPCDTAHCLFTKRHAAAARVRADGKVLISCFSWWPSESKYDDLPGRPEESDDLPLGSRHRQGNPAHRNWERRRSTRPYLLPTARPWPRRRPTRRSGCGTWPMAGKSGDSAECNVETRHVAFSPDGTKLASTETRWMDPADFREGPPRPCRSTSGTRPRAGAPSLGDG